MTTRISAHTLSSRRRFLWSSSGVVAGLAAARTLGLDSTADAARTSLATF
jgi:hypothetical protein